MYIFVILSRHFAFSFIPITSSSSYVIFHLFLLIQQPFYLSASITFYLFFMPNEKGIFFFYTCISQPLPISLNNALHYTALHFYFSDSSLPFFSLFHIFSKSLTSHLYLAFAYLFDLFQKVYWILSKESFEIKIGYGYVVGALYFYVTFLYSFVLILYVYVYTEEKKFLNI